MWPLPLIIGGFYGMIIGGLGVAIASFYCETQISKTKCIEICKSNNPAISGGYNTPPRGAELGSRACPGVHTRDLKKKFIN
jgi:hypothetical protein